jgi:hypothetical protein
VYFDRDVRHTSQLSKSNALAARPELVRDEPRQVVLTTMWIYAFISGPPRSGIDAGDFAEDSRHAVTLVETSPR